MKTAVSMPDDLFEAAERLAKRLDKPRSVLYAEAVAEYLARHDADTVTEALDAACEKAGEESAGFTRAAARRVLERSEW